ncbi:HdeD family acid-resistance protein [Odoribacter sp. Z80]|uniref:HdeD family acid-resistance protein n=1 Tax=Odoribacter sp. Z80 TaxID=2304575 RepID=UPI00137B194A|nr:DUF308 domain-containing protein [Odoribacter sp. Z80]NCE73048.1 hypothetical protein [Odoribacter sp. Z80]
MQIVYTSTNYKSVVYRAVLSIILGVVLVSWPGAALKYIIMLIGLIFLLTGLISYVTTNREREVRSRYFAPFSGIGSLILGLLLLCLPSSFLSIFMFVFGFILVVAAIGQFVTLAAARQFGPVSFVSYLFPVLIFVAGIVILFDPFRSAEGVVILFGVTSIFYGVTDFINQYAIRKLRKKNEDKEKIVDVASRPDIEDAEYEEVK